MIEGEAMPRELETVALETAVNTDVNDQGAAADPLASLIDEHRTIAHACRILDGWATAAEEQVALDRHALRLLITFLSEFVGLIHHEKEETVLMPALLAVGLDWGDPPISTLRQEHDHERYLIDSLRHLALQLDEWSDYAQQHFVSVAREFVRFQVSHMDTENRKLYPLVRSRLSPELQRRLRRDLQHFDSKLQARQHRLRQLLRSIGGPP